MKRIVIGIVLVVGMVFGVWGNGNRELNSTIFKDPLPQFGVEKRLLGVHETNAALGIIQYNVTLHFPSRKVYFYSAYYKVNDDVYFINSFGGTQKINVGPGRDLFLEFEIQTSSNTFSLIKDGGVEGNYQTSQKNLTLPTITAEQDTGTINFTFPVPTLGEKDVSVLILYRFENSDTASWNCEYFKTKIIHEFFDGESEILNGLSGTHSYTTKSFIIMETFFEEFLTRDFHDGIYFDQEFADAFYDAANGLGATTGIGGGSLPVISIDMKKKILLHYKDFIEAISLKVRYREEKGVFEDYNEIGFPYLSLPETSLRLIYGTKEKRNPYISTFIQLYFKKNKPLLEFPIKRRISTVKNYLADAQLNYDYSSHRAISSIESQNIADAASKYLTWGVEYTPVNVSDNIKVGGNGISSRSTSEVFKFFANMDVNNSDADDDRRLLINKWLSNDSWPGLFNDNNARKNNYLPHNPVVITEDIYNANNEQPKRMQYVETNIHSNAINLSAKLEVVNPQIGRIDIWNSYNLAWDNSKINDIIAFPELEAFSTQFHDMKWNITDKKVLLEKRKGHIGLNQFQLESEEAAQNLHIKRPSINDKIEVGYKFTNEENVAGLLLVKGFSPEYKPKNIAMEKATTGAYFGAENHSINMVDGDPDTFWKSTTRNDQNARIDFRRNHIIEWIYLKWSDKERIDYIIQTSQNNRNWYTIYDSSDYLSIPGQNGIKTDVINLIFTGKRDFGDIPINPYECRYMRIAVNLNGQNEHFELREFEVYESGMPQSKINDSSTYVEYKSEKSGEWQRIGFKEILMNSLDDSFMIFPDYKKRNPGYGIIRPEYSRGDDNFFNSNLTYSYIILDDSINCKEIKLVDNSNNDFMNISELMVFPENPVEYISEYIEYARWMDAERINNGQPALYQGIIKDIPQYLNSLWYTGATNDIYDADYRKNFWKNYRHTFFNANPKKSQKFNTSYTYKQGADQYLHLTVDLKSSTDIKRVIVWEPDDEGVWGFDTHSDSTQFESGFIVYSSINKLFGVNLFESYSQNIVEDIQGGLTTPYYDEEKAITGHPLPYTPYGIDSPRTFAYKMYQQVLAREKNPIFVSSKANDNNYWDGYITEIDLFKEKNGVDLKIDMSTYDYYRYDIYNENKQAIMAYKPFLPNLLTNNPKIDIKSSDSLYSPDKSAGVDSIGLLLGAISMSNTDSVYDLKNIDVSERLNLYYYLDKKGTPGIKGPGTDAEGKPGFYATDGSILDYRISKGDLEKMTILVPDISEIRPGDLLVNFDDYNKPHIGIVYKTTWEDIDAPRYGDDYRDFMDKVMVISIRQGIQNVIIGYWGNRSNLFAGFTADPERYQIRRLLKKRTPGPDMTTPAEPEKWELVKGFNETVWTRYNMDDLTADDHPIGLTTIVQGILNASQIPPSKITIPGNGQENQEIQTHVLREQVKMIMENKLVYLEEFPPTHLRQISDRSLFQMAGMDDSVIGMNKTGWRYIHRQYNIEKKYEPAETSWLDEAFATNLTFVYNNSWEIVDEENRKGLQLVKNPEDAPALSISSESFENITFETELETTNSTSIIAGYTNEINYYEIEILPKAEADETATSAIKIWQISSGNRTEKHGIESDIFTNKNYKIIIETEKIQDGVNYNVTVTLLDLQEKDQVQVVINAIPLQAGQVGFMQRSPGITLFNNTYLTVPTEEYLETGTVQMPWLNYHLAIDVGSRVPSPTDVHVTGEGWDFYAPEDGEFWVTNNPNNISTRIPKMRIDIEEIKRPYWNEEEMGKLYDQIQENKYYNHPNGIRDAGITGILVTNPDNPRKGRVYLLSHMGSKIPNEKILQYAEEYLAREHLRYPNEIEKRIKVKAGDWIGKVGQRGWAKGPHIHLEVFEYFNEVYINGNNQIIDEDKDGIGWKKVNPATVFDSVVWDNYAQPLYNTLKIVDDVIGQIGIEFGKDRISVDEFAKKYFKQWY